MNGSSNIELPNNYIKVLDKGYVGLVDYMGSDLSVTAAARVSFDKASTKWDDAEARLLAFLQREGHTSPFRHATLSFEVYAPLFIARQWWKAAVASSHVEDQLGHNESSRRYITEEPTFYVPGPNEWRTIPENKKQGSGEPMDAAAGTVWTESLEEYIAQGTRLYDEAMANNVAPEIARLFLPAYGLYVRWRWTASLGAVMHFLHQRLAHDAQNEITQFAQAVRDLTAGPFPECMKTVG